MSDNSASITVTIRYDENGFPGFTDLCPKPASKFTFVSDDTDAVSDFPNANEYLAGKYGFNKVNGKLPSVNSSGYLETRTIDGIRINHISF